MRLLLLAPLVLLGACATSPAPAPVQATRTPRFRPRVPESELAHKRAMARHAAALATVARPESTPAELEEAALQLEAACKDGHRESCDFLEAHATQPTAQCKRSGPTQAFLSAGANVETQVRCRITETGVAESCTVVLDAPYFMSEQHLKNRQSCHYEPARLEGRPYPADELSTMTLTAPTLEIAGRPTLEIAGRLPVEIAGRPARRMGDPLQEARRRVEKAPQSASAQRHLALMLEEREPGTPEHLRALQHALELLPQDAALLAAAARAALVQGRNEEAFSLALKAVQAQPQRPMIQTYAAASSLVGRCAEAVRAQRHVLTMFGNSPNLRGREAMEKHLAEYEQCAAQAQATAP